MQVVTPNTLAKEFESSVSPNGQITLPLEVRTRLKIKPKDKVTIRIEADEIKVLPKRETLRVYFQSIPALKTPLAWSEIQAIAREEAVENTT